MNQCVGTCSLCGGQVMGYVGIWGSILPPPPPTCSQCGAVSAASVPPVIPMVPAPQQRPWSWYTLTMSGVNTPDSVALFHDTFKATATIAGMPMPDGKWRA